MLVPFKATPGVSLAPPGAPPRGVLRVCTSLQVLPHMSRSSLRRSRSLAHSRRRTAHTHTYGGGGRALPTLSIGCCRRCSASKERRGKNREQGPRVTTSRRLFLSPASHTHTLAPHPTCSPTLRPPPPLSPRRTGQAPLRLA